MEDPAVMYVRECFAYVLLFYLAFSLSFGMKVRFLCSGAKEGST